MKQLLKIVLILLDSPPSQRTDVKTCFLMLWFNCELRIETGNEKTQNKMPCQFMIQNKIPCLFSFQRGKGTHVKTLEVYNVETLECIM